MPSTQKIAVDKHRRLREQGLSRLEVVVPESDRSLLKEVARKLRGAHEEADATRRQLVRMARGEPETGLKALLASAPLDGIDLDRDRDPRREVDL